MLYFGFAFWITLAPDLQIPKGPIQVFTADQQGRTSTGKVLIPTSTQSGLLAFAAANRTANSFSLPKLPSGLEVGHRSLFYMKTENNADFLITNQARTRIFHGRNESNGTITMDVASCGPFLEISDIHISEPTGGGAKRIIVADKKANLLYSYTFDVTTLTDTTLCSSAVTLAMKSPFWIQSVSQASPTLFVGYGGPGGLKVRSFDADDLDPVTSEEVLTTQSRAEFGIPHFDATSGFLQLYVPVKKIGASAEKDIIFHFNAAFTSKTEILSCRSPDQILMDYEGSSRFRYVFCASEGRVLIYDKDDALQGNLYAGPAAKKMLVGSDGTNRYVAVLQSDRKLRLFKAAVTSLNWATNTLTLPAIMDDIGHFGAMDEAVLVSAASNQILVYDLVSQALSRTYNLPDSITSMAAESSTRLHFVSKSDDTAYSLFEGTNIWTLRLFTVEDEPIQINYAQNRLYVLSRAGETFSMIDPSSNTVYEKAVGVLPSTFDLSAAVGVQRAWIANETSQSFTTINITAGSETATSTNTVVGFAPRKVRYQSSDGTIYFGGGTTLKAYASSNLASVATQTLPAALSEMVLMSGGVGISSESGLDFHEMSRTVFDRNAFSKSPTFMASNGVAPVFGFSQDQSLQTFTDYTERFRSFSGLYADLTNLFVYHPQGRKLSIFPFSNLQASAANFSGLSLVLDFDAKKMSSDANGDTWLADDVSLKLQRITSQYQRAALQNIRKHRPVDLAVSDSLDRLYVVLRDLNAVASINLATEAVSYYSVCQSPREIVHDPLTTKLFVRCPELDAVSSLRLDSTGAIVASNILLTGSSPSSLAVATNRLYIGNRSSDNVVVYNTVGNNLSILSTISVGTSPTDLVTDAATGIVYTIHDLDRDLAALQPNHTVVTTDTGFYGLTEAIYQAGSSRIYALSHATKKIFMSPAANFSGDTLIADRDSELGHLSSAATPAKIFLTYPDDDAVRIYDETSLTLEDVQVGGYPLYAYPLAAADRVYVTNFRDDSVTILKLSDNTVVSTRTLTTGCGPTKMASATAAGTSYLYVLCQENDTIEVIETASPTTSRTPLSLRLP